MDHVLDRSVVRERNGNDPEICDLLELESLQRVESYDISNISGFESVGSMVVYEKGKPIRYNWR